MSPTSNSEPKVVLVHDYLTQRGGAERVALAMAELLRPLEIVTSFYDAERTFPGFKQFPVRTLWVDRVPALRSYPRLSLPLLPFAFQRARLVPADVVVVSTSGFAHGVRTAIPKVVYCHNTPRWLYQERQYIGTGTKAATIHTALSLLRPFLRRWDRTAARSASVYLANSLNVAERVAEEYGIKANVLHPPLTLNPCGLEQIVPGLEPGYLLAVSRGRTYKNIDSVLSAAQITNERLVVVGGEARGAGSNLRILGRVTDDELRWLYKNCRALVSAALEDFGLTVVEANSFGRPAIVLRAGGFLETIVEGVTGIFFDSPDPVAIAAAISKVDELTGSEADIRAHAEEFSLDAFGRVLRDTIVGLWNGNLPSESYAPVQDL